MPGARKIVRARSWSELPEVLEPGVAYDVDGVVIRPREKLSRKDAASLVRGIKQMINSG